ncbi:SNF2 family domain-containing protein [Cladophialophora immunda]|nr:SNF2 family domain-containing protein [Cladophialophora immunda]
MSNSYLPTLAGSGDDGDGDDEDQFFDTHQFFVGPSSTESCSSHAESNLLHSENGMRTSLLNSPAADSICHKPGRFRFESTPFMDDYIALGSIRLVRPTASALDRGWRMVGSKGEATHPHSLLTLGEKRLWIKTCYSEHAKLPDCASLRIYTLPEDVNRSTRGSIKDLRKVLKFLTEFVDISRDAWDGTYDPASPLQTYKQAHVFQEESLFYIFNTLSSPQTSLTDGGPGLHNRHSMHDIFGNKIDGLQTSLYPYQMRSVAAMLQREVNPFMFLDPRKQCFRDLNGTKFYLDVYEGSLLRHPHLYSQCRGGILAETMGYGKTLICIALILATRGHYPTIPRQTSVPWKAHFANLKKEGYHFDSCTEALARYNGEYAEPIFHPTTPDRRGKKREDFRVLRLACTTLLIVPPNLLVQWQHEIEKHTEAGALDVLVLDSTTKDIPHWRELIKHDIVLITKARFEQEYRDDDLNQGRRFKGQEKFRSQLTEVRWLRVICDEGHGFAGSSYRTHAMTMLDKMSVERRWVVSGTPSYSLHGVEVNLALDETNNHTKSLRRHSIETALERRKAKDSASEELKDMDRLRAIVVRFLKVQPWANQKGADHADWKRYLSPFDASGKRRFAPALRVILQSLIIRHRIEDIDVDLCLPPLHNRTIYLEPSYYDKLSMNLFRLVLTSNAITSERVDEDYMFHPKNRKSLDELITNLRRSSFHWVGFTEHEVTETLRVSNKYLEEHLNLISDEDGALLSEAIQNGERALSDSGWHAFSFYHEIGVYVEDFPSDAAAAWALNGEHSNPLLLGTVQAREAQQYVLKHLELDGPWIQLAGAGLRAMHAARERAMEEQQARDKVQSSSSGKKPPTAGATEEPKLKNQSGSPSPVRSSTRDVAPELFRSPRKRLFSTNNPIVPAPLAKSRIVGFTSAKLNYLCSRILMLQATEKIIIFYDSNNIAFWIAEALELLSVKFLIYANTLSVTRRAAYLATFNQSEVFRVLLMDLKQASHGLHVAAASRIFIVSPIWQPDVESQAIKRAHRIGQTRPVYVETLVLKGTLEEKILRRRRQMSNAELVKAEKSLLDDGMMNGIIRGEGFLKIAQDEKEQLRGGRLDEPVPLFVRRDGPVGADDGEDGDLILGLEDERSSKKKKVENKGKTKGNGRTVAFGPDKVFPLSSGAALNTSPPALETHTSIFGAGLQSSNEKP